MKKLLKGQLKDNVKTTRKILAGMEGELFFQVSEFNADN